MNAFVLTLLFLVLISCQTSPTTSGKQYASCDTVYIHDTVYLNEKKYQWQEGFGLTHDSEHDSICGRPIAFYLNHNKCSPIAKSFYYADFRPMDNELTVDLLELAITKNDTLRPFYLWCLDKTIQITDGALAELVGVPARNYVEQYPKEFFEFASTDSGKVNYDKWISMIGYSGFTNYPQNISDVKLEFVRRMRVKWPQANAQQIVKMKQFAEQCYQAQ